MILQGNVNEWTTIECARLMRALAGPDAAEAWEMGVSILAEAGLILDTAPDQDTKAHEEVALEVFGRHEHLTFRGTIDPTGRALIEPMLQLALLRREEASDAALVQERLHLLSTASFEGILIHDHGVVLEVNERLGQILGCDPSELLGPGTIGRCVVEEDRVDVYHKIQSAYEGAYVITGLRKDGSTFRAELQSKQGQFGDRPVRVAAVRDVTERERMVELLRESEAGLRNLADAVFDLTVLSRDGIVLSAEGPLLNDLGYDESEMVGRPGLDFVAASAFETTQVRLQQARSGAYQSMMLDKDGEHIPVEVVGVETTVDGQPTRIAGVRDLRKTRDLELERLALQAQVQRSQRMDSLGLLAGSIAHDFNNLLMSVLGNAELLHPHIFDLDQKSMVDGIITAAMQASELTARMLAYAGRGEIAPPKPLNLGELLTDLSQVITRRRDVPRTCELDIQRDSRVVGDKASLTQVFLNLMTNAADAIDETGQITVRTRRLTHPDQRWDGALGAMVSPGDWILVEVHDTGPGMDATTKNRIFEPFFTTKNRGHGLGLAACLGTIETHGGAVHVSSELGRGSCFSVLLPYDSSHSSHSIEKVDMLSPFHVLVVDDEPGVRRQMLRSLRLRGFIATEAADGPACLELVNRERPDVILLDMSMPEMSGVEVVDQLRQRGEQVPIVLTSGYLDVALEKRIAPGSFQAFLRKPFGMAELIEAIDHAMKKTNVTAARPKLESQPARP